MVVEIDTQPSRVVATRASVAEAERNFRDPTIDGLYVVQFTPQRLLSEFAPKVYYARDIPHDIQDLMNTSDAHYRRTLMAKELFEALIYQNTFEDEPNAPRISIVNDVDGDVEMTPAWEFHYSNRIWYGDDVPPPDYENLEGCDCEGYCDPESQACSCAQKQKKYSTHLPGFIYDDKGRLTTMEYPVFECNALCGCFEGCRNRVVQRGRQYQVNIRKTTNKGWGIFAGRQKIPKGSFIGIYAGELLSDEEGDVRGTKYNKFGRTYLFQLDFWYLHPQKLREYHSTQPSDKQDEEDDWQTKYVVDAYHAGNVNMRRSRLTCVSFQNHSCDPNCCLIAVYVNEADIDKPLLALFTCRDVLPWEELCFSYTGYTVDDQDGKKGELIPKPQNNGDAVYAPCLCGAARCMGYMFK
ncbi:hypothetical protein BC834DRAFT_821143 [Gloeopeniophorella convolvens]|nr:hypothetical protein BC834DRAFT_821143 [Gloeopeniophorella convolvens]